MLEDDPLTKLGKVAQVECTAAVTGEGSHRGGIVAARAWERTLARVREGPTCLSALTAGTEEGGATALNNALNWAPAAIVTTGLPFAIIDTKRVREVT